MSNLPAWVWSDEYANNTKEEMLQDALLIAWDSLESISKNGCCDKCQEAALWSKEALRCIKDLGESIAPPGGTK